MTRAVGERIEELLGGLRSGASRDIAEELVRLLLDLYGEGLTRVVAILRGHDPALVDEIARDELLAGLLILHDLHPLDADARIRQAVARVGDVDYLGTDVDGVVRLRVETAGCPSSVRGALEAAVRDAAPEVAKVEITASATPKLFQIGMGPPRR